MILAAPSLMAPFTMSPKEDINIMKLRQFADRELANCSRAILKDIRRNACIKEMRMLAHKLLTVRRKAN